MAIKAVLFAFVAVAVLEVGLLVQAAEDPNAKAVQTQADNLQPFIDWTQYFVKYLHIANQFEVDVAPVWQACARDLRAGNATKSQRLNVADQMDVLYHYGSSILREMKDVNINGGAFLDQVKKTGDDLRASTK